MLSLILKEIKILAFDLTLLLNLILLTLRCNFDKELCLLIKLLYKNVLFINPSAK